jgi:hypothetical protein
MTFDFYFGDEADQTPPEVSWIAGRATKHMAKFKLEADDPAGIQRATVVYTYNDGRWDSLDLLYDPSTHKWEGTIPASKPVTWFAQVVDRAGNVTTMDNKGGFYHLPLSFEVHQMYLPMTLKSWRE